jgi:hypothetical protein
MCKKSAKNENLKDQYFPAMLIFPTRDQPLLYSSAITNAVIALLLANQHQ